VLTCDHRLNHPDWSQPIRRGVVWPPGDPEPVEELCGCEKCGAVWLRGMTDQGTMIFAPQERA
jgi:hypothetical protein